MHLNWQNCIPVYMSSLFGPAAVALMMPAGGRRRKEARVRFLNFKICRGKQSIALKAGKCPLESCRRYVLPGCFTKGGQSDSNHIHSRRQSVTQCLLLLMWYRYVIKRNQRPHAALSWILFIWLNGKRLGVVCPTDQPGLLSTPWNPANHQP